MTGYVPVVVPLATIHVSGEVSSFVQLIEPANGICVRVHVDWVVRSNSVPFDVPWETKVICPPFVPLTVHVSAWLPFEQVVVAPKVPSQTSKLVTPGSITVSVAVFVTLSSPAVIVAWPGATPSTDTPPHGSVAQEPVIWAMVGSLLDHDTPLVKVAPVPSLLTPKAVSETSLAIKHDLLRSLTTLGS